MVANVSWGVGWQYGPLLLVTSSHMTVWLARCLVLLRSPHVVLLRKTDDPPPLVGEVERYAATVPQRDGEVGVPSSATALSTGSPTPSHRSSSKATATARGPRRIAPNRDQRGWLTCQLQPDTSLNRSYQGQPNDCGDDWPNDPGD